MTTSSQVGGSRVTRSGSQDHHEPAVMRALERWFANALTAHQRGGRSLLNRRPTRPTKVRHWTDRWARRGTCSQASMSTSGGGRRKLPKPQSEGGMVLCPGKR